MRDIEERERGIGIGWHELAGRMQCGVRSLRLDGQLIERQVSTSERQRFAELGAPCALCLLRPRVDEIERDALERRARDRNRGLRVGDRVDASERAQHIVVEGLYAERGAVDAGCRVTAKALRLARRA